MSTSKTKRPAANDDNAPPKKKMASVFSPQNEIASILSNNLLSYPKKIPDLLRLSVYNVRSLKDASTQAKDYGFRKYIEAEDPDLIVMTETYITQKDARALPALEYLKTRYQGLYWARKVAILSKTKALKVTYGLPEWAESKADEVQERCITLEFPTCFVIGAYVQNTGTDQKTMPQRRAWNRDLLRYIDELEPGVKKGQRKSVLHLGDFNVMPEMKDAESSRVWNKLPGTLLEEREDHAKLLSRHNLLDVFRHLHPDAREYTHTSERFKGMRLDGFLVSRAFLLRVRSCEIRHEVRKHYPHSSDHWPILLTIEGTL